MPAFATSLAIGFLIGLERERHPGTKAGLRTFALTGLFAAVAALLSDETGSPAILIIGVLIVAAMIVTANARDREQREPGTTTVVALLLCYGLAVMAWFEYQTLAVMLAIVTTSLLYFKTESRGITERLERRDTISILQFAVLMAMGANIVFKLAKVLIVGGGPLFARRAGSMAAVAIGLFATLLFM